MVPTLKAVRTSCLQLFDVFVTAAKLSPSRIPQIPVVVQGEAEAGPGAFGLETAEKICNETFVKLKNICRQLIGYLLIKLLKTLNIESLLLWKNLVWLLHQSKQYIAGFAAASLALAGVPKKLNQLLSH